MKAMQHILAAGIIGLTMAPPVVAQSVQFDSDRLITMCRQLECVRGLQATVGQVLLLRLPSAEFNSQLGVIAAVLFQVSEGADEVLIAQVSDALRVLARYTTDTAQQRSFIRVAEQLLSGDSQLFDLETPFAVSPT